MASATLNYSLPYPENTDQVDVAGDIRNLAEFLDENFNEIISDNVGLMISSNTESGLSVSYNDNDNTIDFIADDFDLFIDGAVSGSATVASLSNTNITLTASDVDLVISGDVSGSATMSNLENFEIVTTVQNDSHYHTVSTIYNLNLFDIDDVTELPLSGGQALIFNSQSAVWTNGIPNKNLFIAEYSESFTLQLSDAGKTVELSSASPIVITVPNSTSIDFETGTKISFVNVGSGAVSFSSGSGVTINSLNGNTSISGQYGVANMYMSSTDVWILSGDLS